MPDPARSKDEQTRLAGFKHILTKLEDFPSLIDKTKDCMNVTDNANTFATDVLQLEVSGPSQSHLIIVDLPELIHSENKFQIVANIQLVHNMMCKYIVNRRSIILIMISVQNDYINQIVLKFAREMNAEGKRTMRIITKPDTLSADSESELTFMHLTRNLNIEFRLD